MGSNDFLKIGLRVLKDNILDQLFVLVLSVEQVLRFSKHTSSWIILGHPFNKSSI